MTMSLTRPRTKGANSEELRLEVTRTRRRPWLAVGSLALIATCTAAFTSLYLKSGHQAQVLVVTRPVLQGATITSDDLAVARLSFSRALAPIAATDIGQVVGQHAAVALVPGTLLTRAELVASAAPPNGVAVVGVAAKSSQLPAGGVVPGETVDVVLTGPPGAVAAVSQGNGATADPGVQGSVSPGTLLVPDVVVSEVTSAPGSSGTDVVVVSLLVPSAQAPTVANASAAGQAALVVVSPQS